MLFAARTIPIEAAWYAYNIPPGLPVTLPLKTLFVLKKKNRSRFKGRKRKGCLGGTHRLSCKDNGLGYFGRSRLSFKGQCRKGMHHRRKGTSCSRHYPSHRASRLYSIGLFGTGSPIRQRHPFIESALRRKARKRGRSL